MTPKIFLSRGIRNNNPGNIRLSKTIWQGQAVTARQDVEFVEFTSALYGLRALMKLLLTYQVKYQLDTVESIINRYAPPHENDTGSYAVGVAKALQVGLRDPINLKDQKAMLAITKAIVRHENGKPPQGYPAAWYPDDLYQAALTHVLNSTT